jgi:hypothetical protein
MKTKIELLDRKPKTKPPNLQSLFVFIVLVIAVCTSGPTIEIARAQPFQQGDVNADGQVDLKDIVSILKFLASITPTSIVHKEADVNGDSKIGLAEALYVLQRLALPVEMNFEGVGTAAGEGDTGLVQVVFSRPYSGLLAFRVSGTADEADHELNCTPDEQGLVCSVSVDGSQAILQVPLTDDDTIEEVEWLGLRLEPGSDYEVGALGEHVITIEDNDTVWEGMFTCTGEELGFSIEILRSGATVTGKLLAEGGGIIPARAKSLDPQDLAFDLTFDVGAKSFSANLPSVPLPSNDTLLGTEGVMWLELRASETAGSVNAQRVEGRSDLGSESRLHIHYGSQPHLNCDVLGSFVLQRRPATPSSVEVPLETIN